MPRSWRGGRRTNRDLRSAQIAQRSLWHRTCQHLIYNITCADYELLLANAQLACQRCHRGSEWLGIDHNHAEGQAAVRGLLCPKCNRHLSFVDAGTKPLDEATIAYLANPFRRRTAFDPARRAS